MTTVHIPMAEKDFPYEIQDRSRDWSTSPQRLADGLLPSLEGAYAISQPSAEALTIGHPIVWASDMLVEARLKAVRPKARRSKHLS
jgi:hypothetical protein